MGLRKKNDGKPSGETKEYHSSRESTIQRGGGIIKSIILNKVKVYHKDTQELFEVSGPMSGMYLLEGSSRKLVTPTTLRREYCFDDSEKPVALYNSHVPQGQGKGVGFLVRKYIIEKIKELAPKDMNLWHNSEKKLDLLYYNDTRIMIMRYSSNSCMMFVRVKDIARSHRQYIQRRFSPTDHGYLEAQIRFNMLDEKSKDIINLIIQDVIYSQRKQKETNENGKNFNGRTRQN